MLLTDPSDFSDLKVAVRLVTAHEAGGDFYEISRLSPDQFGFLVADVSGHDLSVPYMTGALKALAGICLQENLSPEEAMILLNSGLSKAMTCEQYVTACCVKFDRQNMLLEMVSAGHPSPLLKRRNRCCEYVESIGDVLGIFDPVRFDPRRVGVTEGDRLFIYTDGLTEGYRDEEGRRGRPLYGAGQLQRKLEALTPMPIAETVDALVDDLLEQNDGVANDDVLILGIEF